MTTCDQCGLSSLLEDAFHPRRRRRRQLQLCPACFGEEARRSGSASLIIAAFAVTLAIATTAALRGASNAGWVLVNFALLAVILWLITMVHEAGHAIAARLMGLDVYRIVLGLGRPLGTVVIAGVPVDMNVVPTGGLTYADIRDEPRARLKRIVIIAAGPLVDATILWAAIRFGSDAAVVEQFTGGPAPMRMLILACAGSLLGNVLPLRALAHPSATANDGAQLAHLLLMRPFPAGELERLSAIQRAQFLVDHAQNTDAEAFTRSALDRYPRDRYLLVALSAALLNQHRWREGRDMLLEVLQQPDLEKRVQAVVSNNLAWADLHLSDPALIDEARAHAATAHGLLPWQAFVASTYGCVEALHGDPEAALAALRRSIAAQRRKRTRASALSAMAVAYARRGNHQESQEALARAAAVDSNCPLLQIATRRVEAASQDGV
jgi:tetratricopeptide (TPR) repeat protein